MQNRIKNAVAAAAIAVVVVVASLVASVQRANANEEETIAVPKAALIELVVQYKALLEIAMELEQQLEAVTADRDRWKAQKDCA